MGLAVIFPGQGSQAVGMGKALADAHGAARAVFEEVDDALGEKLSALIFTGPEAELTLTANAQPALMAVSMAVIRVLEENGFSISEARYVAGHSLGEYSALTAAGAFSIADAARLLRIRGEAMQAAAPAGEGAMAAVLGLEQEIVETVCKEASPAGICQIANDNGGGQIVISGTRSAVEQAAQLAQERGARRAIMLPVSAPFHCELMAPAAERMAQALSEVGIERPRVPVIANVLAKPIDDPREIVQRLVEQVTGRVRWRESVSFMAQNGIDRMLEAGAGKVLSGLVRRIERSISVSAAGTPEEIHEFLRERAQMAGGADV